MKGCDVMQIPMINQLSYSAASAIDAIDMKVLKMGLDNLSQEGNYITKMMEQSVLPNLGQSIDIKL